MYQTVDPPRREAYVHEPAYDSGLLQVDEIHSVHYEQYGLKDGLPVLFLHGGPGTGTSPANAKFFNPKVYRVVLLDQRGSGKSIPPQELRNNTTHHLVEDNEKLRKHLQIEKWHMVFGGSWGSTLSLVYAQTHPDKMRCLVLRGIATFREDDIQHSVIGKDRAGHFFPAEYDEFLNWFPEEERGEPWAALHRRLLSEDRDVAIAAATAWHKWEFSIGTLKRGPDTYARLNDPDWILTHAKFEQHYFSNKCWLDEGQLLAQQSVDKMKHLHGAIVQGRYDMVCPPRAAWDLHKAWPKSSIHFIDDASHSATEPGTFSMLVEVCDQLAKLE